MHSAVAFAFAAVGVLATSAAAMSCTVPMGNGQSLDLSRVPQATLSIPQYVPLQPSLDAPKKWIVNLCTPQTASACPQNGNGYVTELTGNGAVCDQTFGTSAAGGFVWNGSAVSVVYQTSSGSAVAKLTLTCGATLALTPAALNVTAMEKSSSFSSYWEFNMALSTSAACAVPPTPPTPPPSTNSSVLRVSQCTDRVGCTASTCSTFNVSSLSCVGAGPNASQFLAPLNPALPCFQGRVFKEPTCSGTPVESVGSVCDVCSSSNVPGYPFMKFSCNLTHGVPSVLKYVCKTDACQNCVPATQTFRRGSCDAMPDAVNRWVRLERFDVCQATQQLVFGGTTCGAYEGSNTLPMRMCINGTYIDEA